MLTKLSFRDMSRSEILTKIRSLNVEYMTLIKDICQELQTETPWKELPKAFFKGMPAAIRNKYEETVMGNRAQFKELAFAFRNLQEQYKDRNPTFYRKERNTNLFQKNPQTSEEPEVIEAQS